MKISEIFYTLQGEGKLIGVPSTFVRTCYCNLRCQWCDSTYTSWQPEGYEMTVADVFEQVNQVGAKHVVITGGEPLLQKEEVSELCEKLSLTSHHITIETNATVFVPVTADLISMSPKLASSTPSQDALWGPRHAQGRLQTEVIRQFLNHYECQVKFVIDTFQDMAEVNHLVKEIPIPQNAVILMPQGSDMKEINSRQPWLAEICKEHGYRYSPRLHIHIWGNQRGT